MHQTVTFGEVLMRLSPLGNKKFRLEFYFGGTEVNVAIFIANFGGKVRHVSSISDDFMEIQPNRIYGNLELVHLELYVLNTC